MDMLKAAMLNELKNALDRWEEINESLSRNEAKVSQAEYLALRRKILMLEMNLGAFRE